MEANKKDKRIALDLSSEEILVLLDWLVKYNEDESYRFEDQAEQRVLFDLESVLEKSISEILKGDYKSILAEARENLRDKEV